MALDLAKEKFSGSIATVTIGAAAAVTVGGETTMPFLFEEGAMPHRPLVTLEMTDAAPADWPEGLMKAHGSSLADPVAWAKRLVADFGAQAICIRLQSIHPDHGNRKADEAAALVARIAEAASVPLIVVGCGDDEKDNDVLPKVSQVLKGANALLGIASQTNYKTLAATCLMDGHAIIAESPIDVNIAKQVNILISDMGLDPKRIVMHPTTASLGYGMEYVYSIMERARLAAFIGDAMLAMPFILFTGMEVWRTKEAKDSGKRRGINWETATAVAMLQSGADILVMRHPEAARTVTQYIDRLMAGA